MFFLSLFTGTLAVSMSNKTCLCKVEYGRVSLPKLYMSSLLLCMIFAMLTILSSIKRFPHINLVSLYIIMHIWYGKLYILLHFLTIQSYIGSIKNAIINMYNVDSVIHMHSQKFILLFMKSKNLNLKGPFQVFKDNIQPTHHDTYNLKHGIQHSAFQA